MGGIRAREKALILFDAAYEAFISEENVPHSIYEIPGAKKCAIEFRSFSKTAGFTGTRCGYTIVPHELTGVNAAGEEVCLNKLWLRRQTTKYNGTAYIVQRAAEAVFTDEGYAQCMENLDYYRRNARVMADTLDRLGIFYTGGVNSPISGCAAPAA